MTHIIPPNNRKKLLIIPLCLFLIMGISTAFIHIYQEQADKRSRQQALDELSAEYYNGAFFSMYPIDHYTEEDFLTYRGLTVEISPYTLDNLTEVSEFLDTTLRSGNNLSNVYIGLDPYQIWISSQKNLTRWNSDLEQELLSYLRAYPEVTFEILLPYPSLDYWTKMDADAVNEILTTYRTFICTLDGFPNTFTYFAGAEQWLIANPDNYESTFNTNADISQKIMLSTFCDNNMRIAAIDVDIVFDQFKTMIQTEKSTPTIYPDLSELQIVFFGDSVIGNYTDSSSIPGVISGLSGARVYNFAIGGTQGTQDADGNHTFTPIVNRFLTGELTVTKNGTTLHQSEIQEDQLCFVIHYGLNDYFTGQPIHNPDDPYDIYTYAGALRTGVKQLQSAYPEATILLLTPPFCSYFSNGEDVNSNVGGKLTDYVNAVIQVATEMNVAYLDNYNGLGINADNHDEYLADGCHPNETGRFLIGQRIAFLLDNN